MRPNEMPGLNGRREVCMKPITITDGNFKREAPDSDRPAMLNLGNGEDLTQLAEENEVLILEFGSEACPPCGALRGRIDTWLIHHPGVTGRYVSIERYVEQSAQFGVLSTPTVLAYVKGSLVVSARGYFSLDLALERLERAMRIAFD